MTNEPDQPLPSVVERKLVTILSADVAEYSRLMAEDEEQTLRIFREHGQTFRALVDLHHGRIFNTAGDAFLAEFTSPVEAVRCATDIQAALRTRNDQFPKNRQVRFRIGVNLGDVMMQNTDLLGDGVNVAARLQSAAEPGGICISGSVYDQIRNKLSLNIESLGERQYKNIPQPVRTFTIAGSEDDDAVHIANRSSNAIADLLKSPVAARTSIAVGVLLIVLAAGYWAFSAFQKSPAQHSIALAKPAVPPAHFASLEKQSSALLTAAQRYHRPQEEIDALSDSNARISEVAQQLHGLGSKTGDKAKAVSLTAQMNTLAGEMSLSETAVLERAGKLLWRDIEQPPGKELAADANTAVAAANQAKTNLDAAVQAAQQAKSGAASLDAASQALSAYDSFSTAYESAAQFYISARRSDFTALVSAAHGISDKLVSLGQVNKPWIFASRTRKDAYQTLADDASAAQSEVAQLDELARRAAAASSLRKIGAALARASTIKARLNSLLATSNSAYSVYNQ